MALQLGTFGAWFNPAYDESARTEFVVEAEALGYTTAWLGMAARTSQTSAWWSGHSTPPRRLPLPRQS